MENKIWQPKIFFRLLKMELLAYLIFIGIMLSIGFLLMLYIIMLTIYKTSRLIWLCCIGREITEQDQTLI